MHSAHMMWNRTEGGELLCLGWNLGWVGFSRRGGGYCTRTLQYGRMRMKDGGWRKVESRVHYSFCLVLRCMYPYGIIGRLRLCGK